MTLSLPHLQLSAAESAELAARVAALAKAGLPLEGGLQALAEEIGRPRIARALRNLALRLERGEKFETAVAAPDCRLPAVLCGLIVAGVQSGRLPQALEQFAALTRRRRDVRHRIFLTFAYPVLLLGIVAAMLVFFQLYVAKEFEKVFRDFGTKLPELTDWCLHYSGTVGWSILALAIAVVLTLVTPAFLPLGSRAGRILAWIPVIGPMVRHERIAQFARLMATLLDAQSPMPEALDLTADAMQGTILADQCHGAAVAVDAGLPLDEALRTTGFPESLVCFAAWGQKQNALSDVFAVAAETFEVRASSQSSLLNMVLPPLAYLFIITFIGIAVLSLFLPLTSLVSNLSSGGPFSECGGGGDGGQVVAAICFFANPVFWLGLLLLMLTRWHSGPSPGERKSPYNTFLRVCGWTLTITSFVAAGGILILPGMPMIWLGSIAVVIAMAYGKQVATQQYAMLAMVGAAVQRGMPLEDAFDAFGHERGGWMRQRSAEVATLLLQGMPLPVAVEKVPGVLPPETVPLVRVGHQTGSLPAAIRQALAVRNFFEPVWQSIVPKIGYIFLLPTLGLWIVGFVLYMIVPQMQKILADFGRPLPKTTAWLITAGKSASVFWPLLGFVCVLVTGLTAYMVLRYAGSIRWDLPGMAWFMRRRHAAVLLDALALTAEQQKPLADAVIQLAYAYPQRRISRRLGAAYDDMLAGRDDLDSLCRQRLLSRTDVALLQSALRAGNLAWAARELADSNRRRLIYRTYTLVQAAFPLLILSYAAVVALVGFALFTPLIDVIQSLAQTMKRLGFTLWEVSVALLLLGVLTTLCLGFYSAVNGQGRDQYAQLAAAEEAANVMERLAAVAWDDLPKQNGEKYELSPQARRALPEPRVEFNVSGTLRVPTNSGTRSVPDTLARRLAVTIFWRPQADGSEHKTRLVTWRYKL